MPDELEDFGQTLQDMFDSGEILKPLVWTSATPTEPGHYWYRYKWDHDQPAFVGVAHVFLSRAGMLKAAFSDSDDETAECSPITVYPGDWAGPIPEPIE